MSTIFDGVNEAIVAALAVDGIKAFAYEAPALNVVPCATLVLDEFETDYTGVDQGFGIGMIALKLRYYVSMEKDARLAWRQLEEGIDTIRKALGVDRTLSGAVRDIDIERGRVFLARTIEGGRREIVCEMDVNVRPKPSIG